MTKPNTQDFLDLMIFGHEWMSQIDSIIDIDDGALTDLVYSMHGTFYSKLAGTWESTEEPEDYMYGIYFGRTRRVVGYTQDDGWIIEGEPTTYLPDVVEVLKQLHIGDYNENNEDHTSEQSP